MSLKNDQMYLRVRNTSDEELVFYDLDDEENKEQNKGVQTYLDPGEKVDLPMDADVIHSYEQGSIGSYEDAGKLEASPFESGRNELWVDPNGHDDNPGTKNAPLASIQTAIDRLDEEFGHEPVKHVKLKGPATYKESVIVNVRNLQITGDSEVFRFDDTSGVEWNEGEDGYPCLFVTNMTKEAAKSFMDDGGVDLSYSTGSQSASYTGASLEREKRQEFSDTTTPQMAFTMKNINMFANNTTLSGHGISFLAAPGFDSGDAAARMKGIALKGCRFTSDVSGYGVYLKNISRFVTDGTFRGTEILLDNCYAPIFGVSTFEQGVSSDCTFTVRQQANGLSSGEIRVWDGFDVWPFYFLDREVIPNKGDVQFFALNNSQMDQEEDVEFINVNSFYIGGGGGMGTSGSPIDYIQSKGSVDFPSNGDMYARKIECESFTKSGNGTLEVAHFKCNGSATISGGSTNLVKGGQVSADFVANSGANIELRGVTIQGNLDVNNANTTVHLKGCHIQGDINIEDQSGVSVTMDGGSYMGSLTDPGTNFTRNTGS